MLHELLQLLEWHLLPEVLIDAQEQDDVVVRSIFGGERRLEGGGAAGEIDDLEPGTHIDLLEDLARDLDSRTVQIAAVYQRRTPAGKLQSNQATICAGVENGRVRRELEQLAQSREPILQVTAGPRRRSCRDFGHSIALSTGQVGFGFDPGQW